MSTFELESSIPSCNVTKDMIIQLEDYLTKEIPNILNIPKETILNSYRISINDKIGIEKLKSINDFSFSMFDNSTTKIVINISNINFYLRIAFAKDRNYSDFKIELEDVNARESTISISKGIERIINTQKNYNYLFYPPMILDFVLSYAVIIASILFLSNLISPAKNADTSEFLLSPVFVSILTISIYYYPISRLLHPFITFDSNKYASLVKYRDWFYKGSLGFIIFGTIFVLFRKYIIGF